MKKKIIKPYKLTVKKKNDPTIAIYTFTTNKARRQKIKELRKWHGRRNLVIHKDNLNLGKHKRLTNENDTLM